MSYESVKFYIGEIKMKDVMRKIINFFACVRRNANNAKIAKQAPLVNPFAFNLEGLI
jgi:hypothetical protein